MLDASGAMVADRVKIPTPYPLPPGQAGLRARRGWWPRCPTPNGPRSGSPGWSATARCSRPPTSRPSQRAGHRRSTTSSSPSGRDFDLAAALTTAFGIPTKVANDADIQGAAVVSGQGLELVITLGTGFGTGLFYHGQLMPHLEIAHQPFRKGETYDEQLGEATRKEIGEERWNKRVMKAIDNHAGPACSSTTSTSAAGTPAGCSVDHLPDDVTIVDNTAGILGRHPALGADPRGDRQTDRTPGPRTVPAAGPQPSATPPAALDLLELLLPPVPGLAGPAPRCAATSSLDRRGQIGPRRRPASRSQSMEYTASCRSPSLLCSRSAALAVLAAGSPSTRATVSQP